MKKKIFSCLLALIMVISLLPMTVAAAEDPVPEEQIPAPATGPISEDSPSPDEEGASTLTAGETYWFDLSAIAETLPGVPNEGFFGSGSISRPSQPLPEQTMHWVPFTYTGEFSAYVLNESSAGVKESSEQASTTEESSGTYGYTYPHRIFVSEYNLRRETSWNALKESGLLFGTSYSSENLTYTLRSLTGGSLGANYNVTEVSPANNEWDILMAMGMIKNFGTDYSVTQDTCSNSWYNSKFIVLRGITNSHQGFEITNTYTGATMNDNYPRASFRPVLEIPSDISNSEFHPVELDLNGGKLTTHENYSLADITNLNIVVKSKQSYTAPTATYFAAPTADAVFLYWEDGAGTHYDGGDSVPATVDKLTAIWGHTVTQNLTDVVSTNSATVTARGEAYTTTLSIAGTAPAGSQMTVSVSMGGTAIENAYNAETGVVAISNVNGPITITASATVTPVYGITASPASLPFGTVNTGYTQPEAQTVTITNTGNQELTVALPMVEVPLHFGIAILSLSHGDPVDDLHVFVLFIVSHQRVHQDGGLIGRMAEKDPGAIGNLADSLISGRQLGSIERLPVFHLVYLLEISYIPSVICLAADFRRTSTFRGNSTGYYSKNLANLKKQFVSNPKDLAAVSGCRLEKIQGERGRLE